MLINWRSVVEYSLTCLSANMSSLHPRTVNALIMNVVIKGKRRKERLYPVLVVENDLQQWLITRSALAKCFPEVEPIWKNHPSQTLAYLKTASMDDRTSPRLIFLNPFAPTQQDGWALMIQLKSDSYFRKIPIIVLSHSEEPEDIFRAYALGAASCITKPSSYTKLVEKFYTLKRYWWNTVSLPFATTTSV